MLENKLFSSTNILEGRITGNSQVTVVNATKGDYNGLVKVSWEADQVGADATRYEVARRVKEPTHGPLSIRPAAPPLRIIMRTRPHCRDNITTTRW